MNSRAVVAGRCVGIGPRGGKIGYRPAEIIATTSDPAVAFGARSQMSHGGLHVFQDSP